MSGSDSDLVGIIIGEMAFRVFVSSTYMDLHPVRSAVRDWIESVGHEAVMFERGDVAKGHEPVDESSVRAVQESDAVVCIVGKSYGTLNSGRDGSITATEFREAVSKGKLTFVFVEANVNAEFQTWVKNPGLEMKFAHVDDPAVFEFIREVKDLGLTCPIMVFRNASDLIDNLKRQFSNLLARIASDAARAREDNLIDQLDRALGSLRSVVGYLRETSEDAKQAWERTQRLNHPFFLAFKSLRKYPVVVPFFVKSDFLDLLKYLGYGSEGSRSVEYFSLPRNSFSAAKKKGYTHLVIHWTRIFDSSGNLIPMAQEDWNDEWLKLASFDPFEEEDPFADE